MNPSSIRFVPRRPPHTTWARSACSSLLRRELARGDEELAEPADQATVDVLAEVDVLDRVEQLDAFLERALERLATRDEAHAAGALVDRPPW